MSAVLDAGLPTGSVHADADGDSRAAFRRTGHSLTVP
jgi:hypothetical protein